MNTTSRPLINIFGVVALLCLQAGIANAQVHDYSYDALGRTQGVVSSNGVSKEIVKYGFDVNGNIISYSVISGADADGDGVLDGQDAFQNDPAASIDTDGDGHPDRWNAHASAAQIAASSLRLDQFPNDPARWIQLSVQATSVVMGNYYGGAGTFQLKTSGIGPFTYTSSNAAVATVDTNGLITLIGLGQATVTVTDVGNGSQLVVAVKGVDAVRSSAVVVTKVAGTGVAGSVDGSALSASFNRITGLAFDAVGNLLIAETNRVRRLDTAGTVSTVAGSVVAGVVDGAGLSAQFGYISDICTGSTGAVYVTQQMNSTIRKIDANANVTSLNKGYNYIFRNGPIQNAGILHPQSCALDPAGNIVFVDQHFHIRKIDAFGNVSSIAGASISNNGNVLPLPGYVDGSASVARFSSLADLAIDTSGNIFVADSMMVRKVDTGGNVTTLAGADSSRNMYQDGLGVSARFGIITALGIDRFGNTYVGAGGRVRKIDPSGYVTTLATLPQFNTITGIATDAVGNVFVSTGLAIYKITMTGNYTPVVTPPAPLTILATSAGLSATAPQIQAFLAAATAYDTEDGSVSNLIHDAPPIFPIGSTVVTFTATDSGGAKGTATAVVTVHLDSDGDGVIDSLDAFPFDPAASIDTDGDGHPDAWNANATAAQIAASSLTLDAFPNDPSKWQTMSFSVPFMVLSLGDVNGNGSGDVAVLAKRKGSGKYVVRVKDPNTVPHLIREIGLNNAYLPVDLMKVPDVNGNGSAEVAVLEVDPATQQNRQVQVKDGLTGAKIVNIPLKQSLKPVQMVVLPDANGNGSADVAVLEVDPATGLNRQIQVKDGRTGALIRNIPLKSTVKPHQIVSVGLINGSPALAVSEVDAVTGRNVQIQVKNASTGALIRNIPVNSAVKPHMLVALPDVNGNGSPDLALSEVNATTGMNAQIQVKDAKTGALIKNIPVKSTVKPHMLVSVGSIGGSPAIALSEVNAVTGRNVQIQVKNASTGALIKNIPVNQTTKPHELIVLADVNGNGSPDLALSEVDAISGKNVQVQVKDAQTGGKIRNIPMNPNYTPLGLSSGPDSNGNGIADIGLLEVDGSGHVQVQIKDPLTGTKVINLAYPNF